MDERQLIELLEDLTDSQHDNEKKRDALLERCLNASKLELEEFLHDLSQLLGEFPSTYLPTLKTFTLHLYKATPKLNLYSRWNTSLPHFISQIIIIVILNNLNHSNISGFGELFHNYIKLLWLTDKPVGKDINNKQLAFYTMDRIFSEILDADGVFEVLVSGASGRRCFKSILFDFNMINRIEQEKLLKAVDIVATLVEKKYSEASEHNEQLLKSLSVYKSCTALIETLRSFQSTEKIPRKNSLPPKLDYMIKLDDKESRTQHWNRKRAATSSHNNLASLSVEDKQHLNQLGMDIPQRQSDLPHFLLDIKQRKIGLFQVKYFLF
jgi:hypothetical protein